jgi:hypothetical protein
VNLYSVIRAIVNNNTQDLYIMIVNYFHMMHRKLRWKKVEVGVRVVLPRRGEGGAVSFGRLPV